MSDNNVDRNIILEAYCGKELANPAEFTDFESRYFTFRDGLSLRLKFLSKPIYERFIGVPNYSWL